MSRESPWFFCLGSVLMTVTAAACGGQVARGRMEQIHWAIASVMNAGAASCAPRELALARAHFAFAEIELVQGDVTRALEHMDIAEENAGAAQVLTPERGCVSEARGPSAPQLNASGAAASIAKPDEPAADCVSEADGCKAAPGVHPPARTTRPTQTDASAQNLGPDAAAASVVAHSACVGSTGDTLCPKRSYANVTITDRELQLSDPIMFRGESSELRTTSYTVLDTIAEVLSDFPSMTLEIAAHTASHGGAARNQALSQQQADSVRRYLIERGVAASRLTAQGYGETRPIESNSTSRGRAINRRVELIRTDRVP